MPFSDDGVGERETWQGGRGGVSASSEIFALYKVKHHKVRYAFLHILFALIFPQKKKKNGKREAWKSFWFCAIAFARSAAVKVFFGTRVSAATIKLFNRNLFESPKSHAHLTDTKKKQRKIPRKPPAEKMNVAWEKLSFLSALLLLLLMLGLARPECLFC